MRKKILLATLLCLMAPTFLFAQPYNIVIKGGHVIDPKNNIDGPMDIAVSAGKIALVARNIDATNALQVVDATGMYVTPGLIDMHVHAIPRERRRSMRATSLDGFTFRVGVTTVVDAGSPGWRNFEEFKKRTIDISQTRVLAFLNIVGSGMIEPFEQYIGYMEVRPIVECAQKYSEYIVGFKVAHYEGHDWTPIQRGTEAGRIANLPFMVDLGTATPALPLDSLFLHYLNPGDIYAHCYGGGPLLGGQNREAIVENGQLRPFMNAAKERGIYFDVGHGSASFFYPIAIPAINAGFYPDAISTDLHTASMNSAMKDQLTCMDKFLALGMDLKSVIEASTWKPAQIIKRTELGHLSVGSEADIAILNMRTGKFGLFDPRGNRMDTDKKLECQMTIRAGRIVYDLNGIATAPRR